MRKSNSRCSACNGLITKNDVTCYTCGEPVPGAKKRSFLAWLLNKDTPSTDRKKQSNAQSYRPLELRVRAGSEKS